MGSKETKSSSRPDLKSILTNHNWIIVAIIILIAAGFKLFILLTGRFPFNADEAIVGLMAVHITQGKVPIFFYGQAYMGSLDALFIAFFYLIFGKSVLAIRVVQILLYCGTIATTYVIVNRMTHKPVAGWIAAMLLAIPPVNSTLYTTISLGGYGEALLLGSLIILIGSLLIEQSGGGLLILYGCLVGFGLWVNGITLVFSIPTTIVVFYSWMISIKSKQSGRKIVGFILFLIGVICGAFPWLVYGIQHGFNILVAELLGSAISMNSLGYIPSVLSRIVSFLLFGITAIFGFRPSWEIRWLILPMIPFVAGIWMLILTGMRKVFRENPSMKSIGYILWGVILTTFIGFALTSFGNDPSGRYFLPISIPLAIFAGVYLVQQQWAFKKWKWIILAVLLVFNFGGNLQCWLRFPPGFTTQFDANTIINHEYDQELINFLLVNHIDRGYSTYWVAYPLAFLSKEQLIFIPRLPYHPDFSFTRRDDRYPYYALLVNDATSVAYITANQPWLDLYLKDAMGKKAIAFREKIIGDYTVFYDLSQTITPLELGILPLD